MDGTAGIDGSRSRSASPMPFRVVRRTGFQRFILCARKPCFFVSFVLSYYIVSVFRVDSYCVSPFSVFCKRCPKHSTCSEKEFVCEQNYTHIGNLCVKSGVYAGKLPKYHEMIHNYVSSKRVWSMEKIRKTFPEIPESSIKNALEMYGNYSVVKGFYVVPVPDLKIEWYHIMIVIITWDLYFVSEFLYQYQKKL